MKVLISHPHGNQNTKKVVNILGKLNLLETFWTTFASPFRFKIFKKKIYNIRFKKIKLRFLKEFLRHICIFFKFKKFYLYDDSIFSVNSIYKDLDMNVGKYLDVNKKKINIIYSYEDCALNSFKIASKNHIKTIYDLTSPYWFLKKKIIEEEINLQPDWNLSATEILPEKKCKNKDEEIALSDQIIVASSFAAKSLDLYKKNIKSKINVVPYGITCPPKKIINKRHKNDKLKIIFAGRPTLSKGIQYLIKILDQLDLPWELEIAGSVPEKPHQISKNLDLFLKDPRCKFLGQIQNKNLLQKMRESHIFLFPSLFEGFGQVLLEALSCGLPVITTNNTAGLDIIDDGKNGFLTPIRDTKKTIELINNLYQNEELRISIAENGFIKASEDTWTKYQNELIKIIKTTKI